MTRRACNTGFVMVIIFIIVSSLILITTIQGSNVHIVLHDCLSARTWIVDNEGDGDFLTIQDAINDAEAGDTIKVYSGIYEENIHVFKDELIFTGIDFELGIGTDQGYPIIDANYGGSCIYIASDQVNIHGFIMQHSGNDSNVAGIKIQSDDMIIEDNVIINNNIGIIIDDGENNFILNNNISFNSYALSLYDAHNNVIQNNEISNNEIGIHQQLSSYSEIAENNIMKNMLYGLVINSSQYNDIINNDFLENENAIYLINSKINYFNQNVITHNTIGVHLEDSSNRNNFSDNEISNNLVEGIVINGCSTNTIYLNNINENQNGIVGYSMSLHEIISNSINNNKENGIVLNGSQSNIVSDNVILSKKFKDSIRLSNSHENTINNNDMVDAGISCYDSTNNNFYKNIITSSFNGLYLHSSSENIIFENTISLSNFDGIYLGSSYDNRLYHNFLIDNNRNAYDNGNNQWDDGYPQGGNYWSDYDDSDEGAIDSYGGPNQNEPYSDGIADTPYEITGATNKDTYPLINPWGPPSKPSTPQGLSQGFIGKEYRYSTSSVDPNGDRVQYGWDWDGDYAVDEWTIQYESGETITVAHTWSTRGEYNIFVKAMDIHGAESDWSDPLPVSMPKEKNSFRYVSDFLQQILFFFNFQLDILLDFR